MQITPKITLLILAIVATINNASAQDSKAVKIDSFIRKANQIGLFNGNIEVIEHNQVIYKQAIGFTDATKTVKLTTDYRFHIGSIAKEFSAVGIMMLKEKGRLSLDDKVSKYITGLPAWADSISIKNLLQYTSGLPDVKWKTVKSDADNWNDLKHLQNLNSKPGNHYAYNNNNNFLQKAIIAKISGMTFNEFVQTQILKPCGMDASVVDPDDNTPLMAKSFTDASKQGALIYPISGWTCVTLDDFVKWAKAIADFKLISPESTREILYPAGKGNQAGLGGGSMAGNHLKTHTHDGAAVYYQANLDNNIPKGRTVILLNSNKHDDILELNKAMQAILDGKAYTMPVK